MVTFVAFFKMAARFICEDVPVGIGRISEIEFHVKRILVRFEHGNSRRRSILHEQSKPEYEKPHRFDRAQTEITPSEGKILIKAEIPA
jgi:hypothetical protein